MAQTDGSIILDTQLDSEGFKAGSEELLKALRSLTAEIQGLGKVLTNLFEKPLTPQVDTKPAEQDVAALEAKIRELEAAMAGARGQGGTAAAPTAETAPANTGTPTQEYETLCAELDKVGAKFDTLMGKQEKMQALGVSQESMQWRSLQYDMEAVSNQYQELLGRKQELEASGGAYQAPAVDPAPYDQVETDLSSAAASAGQINEAAQQAASGTEQVAASTQETASGAAAAARTFAGRLGAGIKSAVSGIGNMARQLGGKVVSGVKAAASGMAKLFQHSRAANGQFGGLISGAKKFALSLLGARGIWALLRKAVSAYMAENQQLSNTLSGCWSSIGNLLGPIITKIINLVATATSYVTAFLKLFGLYGKTATKQISTAGGAASKATDKLQRQLASFDELNILSDNSKSGGGGGGGSSGNSAAQLPEVQVPDWAKQIAEQIKAGNWAAAASALVGKLNDLVKGVDWAGIGDKLGQYLHAALTFLATAILGFDWFSLGANLGTGLNHLIANVDWGNLGVVLGAKFSILIKGLSGLFSTLDWVGLGKALSDALMGLWNSIDWVQAAKGLSDGVIGLLTTISTAIKEIDWQQLGNDVAAFIANVDWTGITDALFDGIGAAIGGIAAFLWGLIEDAWNSVVEWWYDTAYEDGQFTISGLLEGIWNGIKDIGVWIYEHIFKPFVDGFKAAFGIHSPSTVMAEQGNFLVEGLLQGITEVWDSITGFFTTAVDGVKTFLSDAWGSIKETASSAWTGVKDAIGGAWSGIKSGVASAGSAVKNGLSATWSGIKTATTSVWNGIKGGLSSTWSGIKSTASRMWSGIKATIQDQGWSGVGSNICTGISDGISAGWTWLKDKVGSLASGLLGKAKEVLGIHSPSRLFRDEVGLNIGYGIGEGVEDSQGEIVKSVSGVAGAIAEEFNNGSYTIGGVVPTAEVDGALDAFSDKISGSFTRLMDRLQAIADRVTFAVPNIATGSIAPYRTAAAANGGGLGELIASNDELSSVITQAVGNATERIVQALREQPTPVLNLDRAAMADMVIREINRRTRSMGASPLLG